MSIADTYLRRLDRAVALSRGSRLARLCRLPLRMALPAILTRAGRHREVTADTFWGGRMNVLLPEIVSTEIWRYGFFDADVCRFLMHGLRPGMTFIDVGGHFGFFTLMGSHLVGKEGRVVSLEPMPNSYDFLGRNVRQHAAHPNIDLVNMAAYDSARELQFRDMGLVFAAFNSAFEARIPDTRPTIVPVKADTLDAIVAARGLARVDMVKIDAESSEMMVLQGMEDTIARFAPGIIIEVGDYDVAGASLSRDLVGWLAARGYAPFEVQGDRIQPHTLKHAYQAGNILFLKGS